MKRIIAKLSSINFVLLLLSLFFISSAIVPNSAVVTAAPAPNQEILFSLQGDTPDVISSSASRVEQTADQQVWTKARMLAAQPYPIPSYDAHSVANNVQPELSGDPMLLPSVPPNSSAPAFPVEDDFETLSEENLLGYDYPAPFTRYENFDEYTEFPYSTIGVMFFSQDGKDYRCSAAVIGENALWTAGHCVHDGKSGGLGWSTNVIFIPAYKDGNGDINFGVWTYSEVVTDYSWYIVGDLRFDIGGVILQPNNSGKTIRDVVGSLGFAYNLSPEQHWISFGYPSEAPFDGNSMQICAASYAQNDSSFAAPRPVAMGCDMTRGSSGGPWVINFSGSGEYNNLVNGNNSYRYGSQPLEMFSPYFGNAARDILNYISSDTPVLTNIYLPISFSNESR